MPDSKLHIELRTSPHLKQAVSTAQIMRNVVYALLPVSAFAVFAFGISVLALKIVKRTENLVWIFTALTNCCDFARQRPPDLFVRRALLLVLLNA